MARKPKITTYENLSEDVVSLVRSRLNGDSDLILMELNNTIKSENLTPPLLDEGKTYGDWNVPLFGLNGNSDTRPSEALPLVVIDQMLKAAPVRFALEMKRAQIVSVFRNPRSWKVQTPDPELGEVVRANLTQILPKMSLDFSFSSLAYGTSFQELVWEYKSKYELGITNSKYQSNKKFLVACVPNSVNPNTVPAIKRTNDGHFDGFVQYPRYGHTIEVIVEADSALVIPYNEHFRNLWGESMLKPMYPIWFWYEIVLRSMVKYMERMGTPVVKVTAPSRGSVLNPLTNAKVNPMSWAMEVGTSVARSSVAVVPSDTDEKGQSLWTIDYMKADPNSQPFLDILELLSQMILRAGLTADRALTQSSGGVGSYAIGEIHQEATSLHNEMILIQWLHYLNTYFLPHYSLYNRGMSGPPIWLETQGLDPQDKQNLTTLLGVAQSMPAFQDVGFRFDWDTIFSTNNIPLLSEAEAKAKKESLEAENLKKQEDMLATQAKFETPSPTKEKDGSLKANLPTKPPAKKE